MPTGFQSLLHDYQSLRPLQGIHKPLRGANNVRPIQRVPRVRVQQKTSTEFPRLHVREKKEGRV